MSDEKVTFLSETGIKGVQLENVIYSVSLVGHWLWNLAAPAGVLGSILRLRTDNSRPFLGSKMSCLSVRS